MEKNVYPFAGHAVAIWAPRPRIHAMCAAYRTDNPPELVLSVSQADIDRERGQFGAKKTAEERHSDEYLETPAVYRKLAESLIERDILLFHGSAVAMDVEPARIRDDLVWEALEKAALADKARALSLGLDAQIGEQGILLSGGERVCRFLTKFAILCFSACIFENGGI